MMKSHTRRRRESRQRREKAKPTGERPAPDILPTPRRPIVDRQIIEREPRATHCRHGVPWDTWCKKCERGEITAAVDEQLREVRVR